MFDLNQIRQLLAIEEYGTLSRAAEVLHLSQPALTRSIQRLEDELGLKLFIRHKNKIVPNDAGRLAMSEAHKVMDAANSMSNALALYARSLSAITVGACAPAPIWELMPELTARFPDISIISELKAPEELEAGLQVGRYQLVVLDHPVEKIGVLCRPWIKEQLFISFPPSHPMAKRESLWLSEMEGQTMLLYSEMGVWHDVMDGIGRGIHFIVQTDRAAFSDLVSAAVLPNFSTNISCRHIAPAIDRVNVKVLDPEATIQFYLCARKQDRRIWEAISEIAE